LLHYISVTALILAFFLGACKKDEETEDSGNPSNLTVEIISIDNENFTVALQATAQNTVEYWFYVGSSDTPEEMNANGYFEYTFEGDGEYTISVRAYGSSGRYLKATQTVTISPVGPPPSIPLSKGYITPMEYDGYELVWQDEFNSNSLNTSNWAFDNGNGCPNLCGWGNNELQYYLSENAWVGDSVLTIEAREQVVGSNAYTSAKLISRGKRSFQYGRIDIRALLPKGKGLWPALWMMGDNWNTVGWPYCGEIDIMEMVGGGSGDYTVYGTAHWHDGSNNASQGGNTAVSPESLSEAYHVFTIIWSETSIQWLVDDRVYNTLSITDPQMSEFQQKFWFILNVAVGGNWPGNPDQSTVFPQHMKIDYIRVFQPE
jgi:hypothetical protein